MKSKSTSRLLIAIGAALILYSQVMDVSVGSFAGERIVNIHLLSRQQNYLWLGGITLLAGILLFAVHRLKQSAEEERQEKESEEAAMREAMAKASAGASKGIAALGSATSNVYRQVAGYELVSRILVGVFVGVTILVISSGVAMAYGYQTWPASVVSAPAFLYSLWPGSASRVKSQLLATNIVLLLPILVLSVAISLADDQALDDVGSVLVFVAAALIVSIVGLYRVRKRARRMLYSTASDTD